MLQDVADETIEAWDRVCKVIEGKGEVEKVVKEYIQGYLYAFFLSTFVLNRFLTRMPVPYTCSHLDTSSTG